MVTISASASLVCTAPSTQGHLEAARLTGTIYLYGQGVSIDYQRALAAYKLGAKGGNASCQYMVGSMLKNGRGMDSPDYNLALVWYEKAAAQDHHFAILGLGIMAQEGRAQQPSYRRAREHSQRAIGLGNKQAIRLMKLLDNEVQKVASSRAGD